MLLMNITKTALYAIVIANITCISNALVHVTKAAKRTMQVGVVIRPQALPSTTAMTSVGSNKVKPPHRAPKNLQTPRCARSRRDPLFLHAVGIPCAPGPRGICDDIVAS
jgi:hypothetical protein